MATGFPVKANYATGDVLTAANMNDLSGTVNYLQYMTPRNGCLNSQFNVWQRGTSISLSASSGVVYTADRWATSTNASQACTVSRQATGDTTNLPNIQYAMRFQRNSGQTGTGLLLTTQSFETINSIQYAGKTVTVSFYARAGANFSSASNVLTAYFMTGTGTDQNRQSGGYTGEVTGSNNATLTTTWQRFSYSYSVASTATEVAVGFAYTPVGTAGANDYFEITGVQLELGSAANTYMPNQPTYQGELAACQRYYWRTVAADVYTELTAGTLVESGKVLAFFNNPTQMRVNATTVDYSTLMVYDGTTIIAVSSLTAGAASLLTSRALLTLASTPTANRPYAVFTNNSTSGYIGFSAEL